MDVSVGECLDRQCYLREKYQEGNCLLNNRCGAVQTKFFSLVMDLIFRSIQHDTQRLDFISKQN
jgi:hypothetical protein